MIPAPQTPSRSRPHCMPVGYDNRAVLIGGKRQLILSGAIHYVRSTPAMWPRLFEESRKAGLNTIETYVFWEQHEPQEGVYDFSGRHDLGLFLDLCQKAGLHVILRIGPYVCAETNFGGLPWWLTTKPGLVTRTLNPPFMAAVDRWMKRLLTEIGDRQITRGGPIILAQLENEYANVAKRYGDDGARYLEWCLACGRDAGLEVPLVMCEGAPKGAIATLNGFSVWSRVAANRKANPRQPVLWTEDWTGWYDTWGEPHHLRPTDDIAHEALRFFAVGGTGINYYMWHGGTNFDRDAMFLQTTTYDFDAPLDEYGLPTVKSESLRKLHAVLRLHAKFLLQGRRLAPNVLVPGVMPQHADGVVMHEFRLGGRQLAIVVNGNDWPKEVVAHNQTLKMPHRSAAMMLGETGRFKIVYETWAPPRRTISRTMQDAGIDLAWKHANIPPPPHAAFASVALPHTMLPQTRDETDYGWYFMTIQRDRDSDAVLSGRVADRVIVWVNGRRAGTGPERLQEERVKPEAFAFSLPLPLRRGENRIRLLVNAIGLIKGDWSIDAPQSQERKGLLGTLRLDGKPLKTAWSFTPGIFEPPATFDPPSQTGDAVADGSGALRWWRAEFSLEESALADPRPWAIELGRLSKGFIWVNGQGLGRYWQDAARDARQARYTRHPHLVNTGYEAPTQRFYHVPADWLAYGRNTILVFEEQEGVPDGFRVLRRT